jgi:hypothetical protein
MSLPERAVIAAWAPSGVPIVTKAKPRERPVIRSVIRLTSETGPCCWKRSWRSFSVVSKERFPTYNLVFILCLTILEVLAVSRNCSRKSGFKSSLNRVHLKIHHVGNSTTQSKAAPKMTCGPIDCKSYFANPMYSVEYKAFARKLSRSWAMRLSVPCCFGRKIAVFLKIFHTFFGHFPMPERVSR